VQRSLYSLECILPMARKDSTPVATISRLLPLSARFSPTLQG